ncbi:MULTISPECIES: AAA family ATPase [unclassified Corallococcus]|uniref:AAA family ATPase n=1 Tax=unclassified Corallococcus TaxID=2685029 RepID=UPI001A8E13A5|nr:MULTISPECIES: AAA family ATPase [unclassified Corallococcus]MBN9681577.1 AAA family ATPase [Corallococcus sp. NCSPR001]WAS86848.1 AAA family ATPase [Corallococcus sp. NCRR]
MALTRLDIAGYRSVRQLHLELGPVTVVVGPNGSGKTNLYRALYLLAAAAEGRLARTLADEGGTSSVMWAGPRDPKKPARMRVTVDLDDLTYELQCGVVPTSPPQTMFTLDPEVKEEHLWAHAGGRRLVLMERKDRTAFIRDADGQRITFPTELWGSESVMDQLAEPHRFPRLGEVQRTLSAWRFYHHFRTDPDALPRHPQVGVRTPVLASDGRDLAAALQTIWEIGDDRALEQGIDDAFPGARLEIRAENGRFSLFLHMPGLSRPMAAPELSDGTLRYLCLLAALLSPRPPPFLALNEPETSLHPDLLEPLGRLIVRASEDSQVWVTTHAEALANVIADKTGTSPVHLEKQQGATTVKRDGSDE